MFKTILLAFATVMLAASARAQTRPCLRQDQIWNFKVLDNRTLIVEDNFHKKYKVSLMGVCNNLNFRERIGFKVFGGTGLSCISPGDDVINRGFGGGATHQICPIKSVIAYTPAMEKADKAAKAAKDAAPPATH